MTRPLPVVRPSEAAFHKAAADYLERALPRGESLFFHVPNGELRDKRVAEKLKAMGVKAGAPDFIIVWRGRMIGIELKLPGGRIAPAQRAFCSALTMAGGLYKVCRSMEEIEDFLLTLQIPLSARLSVRGVPMASRPEILQ